MTMHARETRIRDMIEALADFTASPGKGTTRLTYSAQHRAALDYLVGRMQAAGLSTRIDSVGNLIGRLEGSEPSLPPSSSDPISTAFRTAGPSTDPPESSPASKPRSACRSKATIPGARSR